MRIGVALGEGPPLGVGALFPTPGEPGQALFVPVVVNVGAVEAVDDGGGVVEGLGRLEDGEGDEGAAAGICAAPRVDGPVGNAELTGLEGQDSAILAAHVRDAGADPRLRRPRAPRFVAIASCFVLHLRRLTRAQRRHLCHAHVLTLFFICFWVAEQDTAGRAESARACSQHPRVRAHRIPTSWVRGRESPRWSWNP